MAITQEVIPNFIGGVSQQPDKLKYPNQAKELLNMLPDPTIGLSKRKPTEHIGRLMDVLPIQPKVYTVNKETEKYQVFLTSCWIITGPTTCPSPSAAAPTTTAPITSPRS